MIEHKFLISNLNDLELLAKALAKQIKLNDTITLTGGLGAGKTTFVKFLVNSIANKNIEVTSPTFNILNIYEFEGNEIWHFDLYRLKNKNEIYEIGVDEALEQKLTVIEWPEIIKEFLPRNCLEINIEVKDNDEIRIFLARFGDNWKNRIEEVISEFR